MILPPVRALPLELIWRAPEIEIAQRKIIS